MLLSWGLNARKVEAGGAGINVVITYKLEHNWWQSINNPNSDEVRKTCMEWLTLNVIILNNETFPPQADITYESFFDSAIHGTDSSRMTPETSLAIRRPLFGCQCWGTILAVAFKHTQTSWISPKKEKSQADIHKLLRKKN